MTTAHLPAARISTGTALALPQVEDGQARRVGTPTPTADEVAMPRNNRGSSDVLNRQDFINDEHVQAFSKEVATAIAAPETSRLHRRVFPRQYRDRDRGGTRRFSNFDDALAQYHWDENDFPNTEHRLSQLKQQLNNAVGVADPSEANLSTVVACFRILDWGGGGALRSSNVDWLVKKIVAGSPLGALLRHAVRALGDGNGSRNADLSGFRDGTYRSNAGLTKIYSLLSDNTFIIYDSRVAAALGMLIANWCDAYGMRDVPDPLRLHWMPSKEGPNAEPKARDPSIEPFRFSQLTGTNANFNHAKSNVRANWIIELVLEQIEQIDKKTSWTARRIEAALFMIGYDLADA